MVEIVVDGVVNRELESVEFVVAVVVVEAGVANRELESVEIDVDVVVVIVVSVVAAVFIALL